MRFARKSTSDGFSPSATELRRWMISDMTTQLEMLWPVGLVPPAVAVPEGYQLRRWRADDEPAHAGLMRLAGFADWRQGSLATTWLPRMLPDGFIVVEHSASASLVATCMATRNPTPRHPEGGELGWVAGDPAHRGKGLGLAVCAAALGCFSGGWLSTHLPAHR